MTTTPIARDPGYTSSAGPGFDTFGRVKIPIQPIDPTVGTAADPALDVLLSYLQAFLSTDQNAELAWRVPGVDPAHRVVRKVYSFDPEEYVFDEKQLPALYGFRVSGSFEPLADDWDVSTDVVKVLWAFPLDGPIERALPRSSFVNGIVKAVRIATERGRTPSWIVEDDTDPMAPIQGSFLGNYLNAYSLWLKTWQRTHITVRDAESKIIGVYPALELQFQLQETWATDIDGGTGTYPTSAEAGVDFVLDNGQSGRPQVEGLLAGTPVIGT